MLKGSFCQVLVLSYSQFTFTGYIRGTRHCFLYIVLFNINNNPMRQILLLFLFSHMSKLRHKQINLPDFAQLVNPALRLIPKCSSQNCVYCPSKLQMFLTLRGVHRFFFSEKIHHMTSSFYHLLRYCGARLLTFFSWCNVSCLPRSGV